MTQQTDPQEVLARLAQRVEGLRRECQHTSATLKCCSGAGYQPLPLNDAVAWLLGNKVVVGVSLRLDEDGWVAMDKSGLIRSTDPDWRTAVLLAAEKALGES